MQSETGNTVSIPGWEYRDLDENNKVRKFQGWFDTEDYDRQVSGVA